MHEATAAKRRLSFISVFGQVEMNALDINLMSSSFAYLPIVDVHKGFARNRSRGNPPAPRGTWRTVLH
jgi:hypothetical protein